MAMATRRPHVWRTARNRAEGYSVAKSFPLNRNFQKQKKSEVFARNPVIAVAQHPLGGTRWVGGGGCNQDEMHTLWSCPPQTLISGDAPPPSSHWCDLFPEQCGYFSELCCHSLTLKHTKRKTEVGLYTGNFPAGRLWFFST